MALIVDFELRIIRVHWANSKDVIKIETAKSPVFLYNEGDRKFSAEIFAYPKVKSNVYGQLAIFAPELQTAPKLILEKGRSVDFSKLKDKSGRVWWIEKGKWRKPKGHSPYYDAPLCRHAGIARLEIGHSTVTLNVAAPGFTQSEFQTLLDEFRNGLWRLILSSESPTKELDYQADVGLSQEFYKAVKDHIHHTSRALVQPHCELRETQEKQLITKVRPTTKTFQEIATRGMPRYITGRGHVTSFNTKENQQLVAMSYRLLQSIQAFKRVAEMMATDFGRQAIDSAKRLSQLEQSEGLTVINPQRIHREITELFSKNKLFQRQAIEYLDISSKNILPSETSYQFIVTTDIENQGPIGFWSIVKNVNGEDQEYLLKVKFTFSDLQLEHGKKIFRKEYEYKLNGVFQLINTDWDRYDQPYYTYRVITVTHLSCYTLESKIEFIQKELQKLQKRNYQRESTDSERKVQKVQEHEEKEREKLLLFNQSLWLKASATTEPYILQLNDLIKRAGALEISYGIGGFSLCGSMTYVQNPHYRGSLTAYRNALEAANLDTTKLDTLLRIEEVGILDLPTVYERWCLLKIIITIVDHFRMVPEPAYRSNLLKRLASEWADNSPLTIRFENEQIQNEVILDYQPRMKRDGRHSGRPDFVLTIKESKNDSLVLDEKFSSKLILDAKCKQFSPVFGEGTGAKIVNELDELITKREYDQCGKNRVFVIHPGYDGNSSDDWRNYCHYGGEHLVADLDSRPQWDHGPPDHRHGAVLLRPGSTDHLVRLILMHLYLSNNEINGAHHSNSNQFSLLCPTCGCVEMTKQSPYPDYQPNRKNSATVWCKECNHMIVPNHSSHCRTRLWKLGEYWTFHETDPLNPYDIKCPHCGGYFNREPVKIGEYN